jgi:hypothetical protein
MIEMARATVEIAVVANDRDGSGRNDRDSMSEETLVFSSVSETRIICNITPDI